MARLSGVRGGVGGVIENKMCFEFITTSVWNISSSKKNHKLNKNGIGLHVNYPLFLSDFNKTWIFSTIFEKYSDTKFHEYPSSGSRVVSCGRTDRQTDMTKVIVAFRNFSNAPENERTIAWSSDFDYAGHQRSISCRSNIILIRRCRQCGLCIQGTARGRHHIYTENLVI